MERHDVKHPHDGHGDGERIAVEDGESMVGGGDPVRYPTESGEPTGDDGEQGGHCVRTVRQIFSSHLCDLHQLPEMKKDAVDLYCQCHNRVTETSAVR